MEKRFETVAPVKRGFEREMGKIEKRRKQETEGERRKKEKREGAVFGDFARSATLHQTSNWISDGLLLWKKTFLFIYLLI